jgi:hypothetical protein
LAWRRLAGFEILSALDSTGTEKALE